jgi:hypothetical protein
VSQILSAVHERKLRDILVAGTVGEAVAAEFALIADDIAATVRVREMLVAKPHERLRMYPGTMHGLHALIYGLIAVLDRDTAPDAIEILAGIRTLGDRRPEPVFRQMPLAELCTYGFELLIRKGLDTGIADVFLESRAYREYAEERRALGLEV